MPTVEYNMSSCGHWIPTAFSSGSIVVGSGSTGLEYGAFINFGYVRFPRNVTITSAYVSVYVSSPDSDIIVMLSFNDVADAVPPTNQSEAAGKILTTNYITWNIPNATGTAVSGDCSAIIQELLDSYGQLDRVMAMLITTSAPSSHDATLTSTFLHIEYDLVPNAADYAVSTTANDGFWRTYSSLFGTTSCYLEKSGSYWSNVFMLWTVNIPAGAIIEYATVMIRLNTASTNSEAEMYFNDTATPIAPTGYMDADSKVKTTAHITWVPDVNTTNDIWFSSGDCSSIIQELVNSYNYSSGGNMMMLLCGTGTVAGTTSMFDSASGAANAAHLYIEYTLPDQTNRSGFFKF